MLGYRTPSSQCDRTMLPTSGIPPAVPPPSDPSLGVGVVAEHLFVETSNHVLVAIRISVFAIISPGPFQHKFS